MADERPLRERWPADALRWPIVGSANGENCVRGTAIQDQTHANPMRPSRLCRSRRAHRRMRDEAMTTSVCRQRKKPARSKPCGLFGYGVPTGAQSRPGRMDRHGRRPWPLTRGTITASPPAERARLFALSHRGAQVPRSVSRRRIARSALSQETRLPQNRRQSRVRLSTQ